MKQSEFTRIFVPAALALLVCLLPITATAELLPGRSMGSFQLEKYGGGYVDPGALGKPAVIAFFISAGNKSAAELKALEELLQKDRFSGYAALAVMRGLNDKEKRMARQYLDDNNIGIQLVFDTEKNELAKHFGIKNAKLIPSFYVFDAAGIFRVSSLSVIYPTNRLTFENYLDRTLAHTEIPFIDMVPKNEKNAFQKKLRGKYAPGFTIPAINGKNYSLSEYRGKKNVILVFWSPNCGHCRKELPKIQAYYTANRMKYNFEVLSITGGGEDSRKAAVTEFTRTKMITFPVLVDDSWTTSGDYGVKGIPITFFIDTDGVVREFLSGAVNYFDLLYESVFSDPGLLGPDVETE